MTKTCPVCETENQPGAKHCDICGERLPIPQAPAAGPTTAAQSTPEGADQATPQTALKTASQPQPPAAPTPNAAAAPTPNAAAAPNPNVADTFSPSPAREQPTKGNQSGATEPKNYGGAKDVDEYQRLEEFDALLGGDHASTSSEQAGGPAVEGAGSDTANGADQETDFEAGPTLVDQPAVTKQAPVHEPTATVSTAKLVVYHQKQPVHTHPIAQDETLIGRYDPTSDAYPDLDLTQWDESGVISRKHAYIYRQAGNYSVYPISQAGTQVGSELVEIGTKRQLEPGEVIILAGALAMKFEGAD